jgi:ATP-dependent DNA ligase
MFGAAMSPPRINPVHSALPPDQGPQPPSGDIWLHEIKLDGFRVIARDKDAANC